MKVRELMELLAQENPESEVWTEGCDCWGDVASIADGGPHQNPRTGNEDPTAPRDVLLMRSEDRK